MRGRPPKPRELRELQGNPGRRPLPSTPPRAEGRPRCPAWLTGEGRRFWRRLLPLLEEMNLLSRERRPALAMLCHAWARWREAEEALDREGLIFETPNGYIQQRPEVGIARRYSELTLTLLREFGLTPVALTRIGLQQPANQADPDEDFLFGSGPQPAEGQPAAN